jgi:protein subunit release factor B
MRTKILSVSIHDCEVQHFRSGGSGGQNQNKRDTGARVIHHPSGARGESREERSQRQNKKAAFLRMIETKEFLLWMKRQQGLDAKAVAEVDQSMYPNNIKVEFKIDGKWVEQ